MNPDDDFYFKSNVTGMVTDENDEPLVGVSVMQRSTKMVLLPMWMAPSRFWWRGRTLR